jgi:sugar lactone lactonase YvrE
MNWVLGLDAPKGLTIANDKLYASDINKLVEIDIDKAKILNRYVAPAAVHLNDVAADEKGYVYVSDTLTDSIYLLNKIGLFPLWLYSPALEAPNGLYIEGDNMIVASWGFRTDGINSKVPGHLKIVSLINKSIKSLGNGSPVGNLDGIEADAKGNYYVTDWVNGKLLLIKPNGDAEVLLDLSLGAADIEVILGKQLIIIPLMKDNKVVAYKINN